MSYKSVLAFTWLSSVAGHGYLSRPVPRGVRKAKWSTKLGGMIKGDPYATEPQSMGATGGGSHIPICGRLNAEVADRKPTDPLTQLVPGKVFPFQAEITAHHMGHMIVRICPLIDSTWKTSDLKQCKVLSGTNGKDREDMKKFWWLDRGTGTKTWRAKLPPVEGLPKSKTGVYTIQWRWNTANSCCSNPAAYRCMPNRDWCFGPCKEESPGECKRDALDVYTDKRCDDDYCCSETFTNCADVTFLGVKYKLPDPNDNSKPKPPPPVDDDEDDEPDSDSEEESDSGSAGGTGVCIAKGPWAGQKRMDDWCKKNADCGDNNANCDCTCGGDSVVLPDKPPGHKVVIAHLWRKLAHLAPKFDLSGLTKFCQDNKHLFCGSATWPPRGLKDSAPELCECEPVPEDPTPTPEPEPTRGDMSGGEDGADNEGENNADNGGEDSPCDNDTKSCKAKCARACSTRKHTRTNQCWGNPRHIECVCNNGEAMGPFPGCVGKNHLLAQTNATAQHSTKFSRHTVHHQTLQVDANGRAKSLSLDEEQSIH